MNKKPLVIKVQPKSVPAGDLFKWSSLTEQMPTFTRDITTPFIAVDKDGNTTVNIGAIVSGMPTIFARANLFKLALNYKPEKDSDTASLMSYYKSLIDEWRGLIACIALDYSRVEIERVELQYSDKESVAKTSNIYEPKGAFGNLLFDRKPLWCDQGLSHNQKKIPFIDVIKYQGEVVGATSPDSFLFSSVAYRITDNLPFVSTASRKFTDPLKSKLEETQIKSLYAYVEHVLKNIEEFRIYFNSVPENIQPQLQNISGNLEDWKREIEQYAERKNVNLEEASIPQIDIFKKPFSILFNYSDKLYGLEGVIYEQRQNNTIEFDPRQLLLPKNSEIACLDFGCELTQNPALLSKQPIFVLKANCEGMSDYYQYFALPLSPLGLNVFGKNIAALIGMNGSSSTIDSRMTAIFYPDRENDNLRVTLTLRTLTGKEKVLEESYTVGAKSIIRNNDILIWPNFVSKQWNRYFMYSELPHNEMYNETNSPFQATPLVGDVNDDDFKICMHEGNAVFLAENGYISIPEKYKNTIKARLHIVSDSRIADNGYKYEIYECNQPFKGVRLKYQGKESGYLIIRYGSESTGLPRNYLKDNKELAAANLGIDFGSTNSSVAYWSERDKKMVDEIRLKNRRVSLLSSNDRDSNVNPAIENEIFFFQSDEIRTNAIKSVLAIHGQKRIVKDNATVQNISSLLGQSVKGGFACFEKNLPIESITENRYKLSYKRAGIVEMVYNMKWATEESENAYKKAYLSSLLLHIYAQLFEDNHYPKSLKWSYPSSMGKILLGKYSQIWSVLSGENPLVSKDETPYNLTVYPADISIIFDPPSPVEEENGSWEDWDKPSINEVNEIKTEHQPIKFNFYQLPDKMALTEACAVANYIYNQRKIAIDLNNLTLCFDVGGSTTDISALCYMKGEEGKPGLAMIKQNSIRFAAQRLSYAAKYSPNFKSVLLEMCSRTNLKLQGLNVGDNKFSSETAPYFFEQLVDKLKDADFPEFYRLIHAQCPELMVVNVYVTGLIMFYAGQLSYKLVEEIKKSEDRLPIVNEKWKPRVNIVFAGKGARIFDWLEAINTKTAKNYFTTLFIEGFGGVAIAKSTLYGPPNINPTNKDGSSDVKYEVSKGLAYPSQGLLVPRDNQAIEILGEEGFVVITPAGEQKSIPYNNSITPEMMESIGVYFLNMSSRCPRFEAFVRVFRQPATSLFGLKMTEDDFKEAYANMNINQYIRTLPEYYEAIENKKETPFDFVAPIIIMEGMKFYDDYLLKGIAKK